jgi:RNA polymerase sigma-70 factor
MGVQITYEAIKNGDIKAFEALFRELYPSMCLVATKFITDQNAAEDIAQEAFIKLWEKRNAYQDIPCLKTFLYVSVKNLCFNYIRDKKITIDYTSPEVENQEAIFKDLLIEEEAFRIIDNAVNALPPQSARIVKMYLDGKQNKEIAEILGISVNSVKTLKYNALNLLKTLLKEYFYVLLLFLAEK